MYVDVLIFTLKCGCTGVYICGCIDLCAQVCMYVCGCNANSHATPPTAF